MPHASYKYLGLDQVVTEDYTDLEVKLDYAYRDTVANQLSGLDRFGRIVDQVWAEYGVYPLPPVPGGMLDEYTYTYDRASNRTSRTNALDWALSEIYAYDPLNRLTSSDRYDGSAADQSWGLDAAGNLGAVTTGGTTQNPHQRRRQRDHRTTNGRGPDAYDAAGNMTTLAVRGATAKYDAWNRLVEVDSSTGTEKYVYDGLNRRVAKTNQDGSMDQYYYNQQWQVVEDNRVVSNVTHWVEQYVWSARGGDAPIARLHDGDVDGDVTDDPYTRYGVSDWSCYYTTDANGNVTTAVRYDNYSHAVETVDGLGVNHYSYTAYGVPARYDQVLDGPGRSDRGWPVVLRLLLRPRHAALSGPQPLLRPQPLGLHQPRSNRLRQRRRQPLRLLRRQPDQLCRSHRREQSDGRNQGG